MPTIKACCCPATCLINDHVRPLKSRRRKCVSRKGCQAVKQACTEPWTLDWSRFHNRWRCANLPHIQINFNKISRLLMWFNINTSHVTTKINVHFFRTGKDDLCLRIPGIYCILFERSTMHVGQMGHTVTCAARMANYTAGWLTDWGQGDTAAPQ
jgi:hypothetical protein